MDLSGILKKIIYILSRPLILGIKHNSITTTKKTSLSMDLRYLLVLLSLLFYQRLCRFKGWSGKSLLIVKQYDNKNSLRAVSGILDDR